MDNINGALAFKATLDINDFNVSAQAMERHIRQVSNTAISESSKMDDSILSFAQNGAKYIISYLVGQGMGSLVQSIVQTRGQFQQLEIAFSTMLRSSTQAQTLMDRLIDTAAKTPFDLQGIASSAKQMLAYGSTVDTVVDELVMLGNVASGVGAPLSEIAYLYGTLRTQGRAYTMDIRQFAGRGIPIYEELSKVLGVTKDKVSELVTEGKVGFPEVEKAFQNMTSSAGIYYNLMQEQSKSLTGMISNMEDAWDSMLNEIGRSNQDTFASIIGGATSLIENYDKILNVVKTIAIAYGSVKAAIVLNTIATKGYTGVALLDNTARQAKLVLMKTEAVLTGQVAAQTKAMQAATAAQVAQLQQELTVEEQGNIVKQLRVAAINSILTAQQQEYLSFLNITTASKNYEAVTMEILTVEQKAALSKIDLSSKSAAYRAALQQEVAAKKQSQVASMEAMRADVKAAYIKMESAKADAVAAKAAVERSYLEVYRAQQTGNAEKIAIAIKKMEGAEEKAAIARKSALAAQSDFYAKKKILEANATKQSTAASIADTTIKATQGTVTSVLTSITTKATMAIKTLWVSMMSNPIGWVLGLFGALVSVLTLFSGKQKEATTAMGEFNDTTKKEIDDLELLFTVLKNTDNGTKLHKETIEKINSVCKKYNKTLLDENATLDLQREKYEELKVAIQETTAEKIKAKYAEKALNDLVQNQSNALNTLRGNASSAKFKDVREVTEVTPEGVTIKVNKVVDAASKAIRNAHGAVWDAVESMAINSASELKILTGDAYTEAFNSSLESIVYYVKKSTEATDKEMDAFKTNLKTYLESIVQSTKRLDEENRKLDKQLEPFSNKKDSSGTTDSIDYIAMSFEELDKKAKKIQASIDAINGKEVKVEADTTQLTELNKTILEINNAVKAKEAGLNTEKGISDRIKQLKEERETVEINSTKYKQLSTTIKGLEDRLPNKNSEKLNDTLNQKRLDAQRKLEEQRIAVMEEGYEKRKAMLELQHKNAIAQIDKEEKELSDARKKAGKGGLTQEEKSGFSERRSLEDISYQKSQNKLFDGEIEYKKQQYQLYFRWVRNFGEEVANEQFKSLLQGGNSYKEYVQNEIKALTEKKNNGNLTEGERNQLISLNMQYDEIIGAKSAMDAFKQSVTNTIGQAQTLAEKLEALAELKDKLENGGTGLVGADEKAEANLILNEEEVKLQEELQNTIIAKYKTYEEEKLSIQKQYALLRKAAEEQGNKERIAQVNQAENEALSSLNASMLKQSKNWKKLFSDLDNLSAAEIAKLISDIEKQLQNSDLKLNPVDYKAVLDSLEQAKQTLQQKNPFKALGEYYDNYIKAKDRLAKAKANLKSGTGTEEDVKKEEAAVRAATKGIADSISTITDAANSCGQAVASIFSNFGKDDLADGIGTAIELMDQLGNAASSVGKLMSGNILGGVTGIVSSVTSVVSIFANLHDKKYEKRNQSLQKDINALEQSYNRLERAFNNTYWVFTDTQRDAYEKNISLIEEQIKALEREAEVASKNWDFTRYAQLNKEIKELNAQLKKAKEGGDMFSIFEAQKANLLQQQEEIRKQIENEKAKKKTDDSKIQSWEEQIETITNQIEDLGKQMMETLAGTDIKTAIDEFADALVDAYCQGEDAAEALGEKTKQVLKNAVVEALKRQFLAQGINDAVNYLSEAMKDSVLTDEEKKEFERRVNAAGELFNNALEGIGDWIKDTEEAAQDPLTGAVTSMSEETGGIIAGRLNAFIINQSDQTAIMRQALVYQAEIAANTKVSASELAEIRASLKRIETKDNSFLSQGIS